MIWKPMHAQRMNNIIPYNAQIDRAIFALRGDNRSFKGQQAAQSQ